MSERAAHQSDYSGPDRRSGKRTIVNHHAELISRFGRPKCRILDVSPTGARIECFSPLPYGEPIVLVIDGFGNLQALVARAEDTVYGLRFVQDALQRDSLTDWLTVQANQQSARPESFEGEARQAKA